MTNRKSTLAKVATMDGERYAVFLGLTYFLVLALDLMLCLAK